MKDVATLNKLSMTTNLLAYIEQVKKAYLERYNINLDLKAIIMYMEKYVEKLGANRLYIQVMIGMINDYYNENGTMKY